MTTNSTKKVRESGNVGRKHSYIPRNPVLTKRRILEAAIEEFAAKGLSGARVERIAKSAGTNMRMIYHYFTDKELLYIAAIEEVYRTVREAEQELHFEDEIDPRQGLVRLVDFTFRHFAANPDLISIVMNENILHAEYLKRSTLVPAITSRLSSAVKTTLDKGFRSGAFKRNPDPVQLWLTIFSLCWVHLANRHTMSWTLQLDLSDEAWLDQRRQHVVDVVLSYLCSPENAVADSAPATQPARKRRAKTA